MTDRTALPASIRLPPAEEFLQAVVPAKTWPQTRRQLDAVGAGYLFAALADGSVRLLSDTGLGTGYFPVQRQTYVFTVVRQLLDLGATWGGRWRGWKP